MPAPPYRKPLKTAHQLGNRALKAALAGGTLSQAAIDAFVTCILTLTIQPGVIPLQYSTQPSLLWRTGGREGTSSKDRRG